MAFDLDSDGDLDLVAASNEGFSNGSIILIENLDAGTVGTAVEISPRFGDLRALDLADINGDGRVDAIVGDATGNRIVACMGQPGSLFAAPIDLFTTNDDPVGVVARDFDGDGDIDVAVAEEGFQTNSLVYFANDGTGAFPVRSVLTTVLGNPTDLKAADLDGDGQVDLVSTSFNDDKLAAYRNIGGGNFDSQLIVSSSVDGAIQVAIGDLDGDGLLDLSCASFNDGGVRWFKNTGGFSFSGQPTLDSSAASVRSVTLGDIDRDGDLDVAAVAQGTDGVRWYENVGFGFFSAPKLVSGSVATLGNRGVVIVDIDQDSDGDILFSEASFNLNVTEIANTYCTSNPNSTMEVGDIFATGSSVVAVNELTLHARDLPLNSFGYFLTSRTQGCVDMPGGSQGKLCLGGAVGRYSAPGQIQFSAGVQAFALTIDQSQTPDPAIGLIAIQPGESWNFQAWYRDQVGGAPTSNFTNALSLNFQ